MSNLSVNLLPEEERTTPDIITPRPTWKKIIAIFAILTVIGGLVFSSSIVFSDASLVRNLAKLNLFGQLGRLISSQDRQLIGESQDRINLLLIGIGGKNHEGGTLADTIIVASIKPSTKQVALMSIPRDLSVPTRSGSWIKVNAVHAYAEKDRPGSGGDAMRQTLSSVLGIDIPYYATVDFDGFEKLIDEFGGVDIEVERDLIDYQYPVRGREDAYPYESRYETLSINKGLQHMDGELALKYTRSRHALGAEGSDFARSKRQQKIITALKGKIVSFNTLVNPNLINGLLETYHENVETNLALWEILLLGQLGKDVDMSQLINYGLTDGPQGLLHAEIRNGAYVLIPDGNNFDAIKQVWGDIFVPSSTPPVVAKPLITITDQVPTTTDVQIDDTATTTDTVTEKSTAPKLTATIEIQNGTFITGWAGREQTRLNTAGLNVTTVGNAPTRDHHQVTIYYKNNESVDTIKKLTELYPGAKVTSTIPASITLNTDILVILGQ